MKAFFFKKLSSFVLISPTWKIFRFFAKKTSQTRWKVLAILKKFKDFCEKTYLFFKKKPKFERFEKSHYCSRILQQIFYILEKTKFHGEKREQSWPTSFSVNATGKHRVKKTSDMTHLSGWFCFHIV